MGNEAKRAAQDEVGLITNLKQAQRQQQKVLTLGRHRSRRG